MFSGFQACGQVELCPVNQSVVFLVWMDRGNGVPSSPSHAKISRASQRHPARDDSRKKIEILKEFL